MKTFADFVRANVIMTVRNKQALFWSFVFPVLLMGLLGIVFGQEDNFKSKLAVVDEDHGSLAATLTGVLRMVPPLDVVTVPDRQTALVDLKDGDYAAVLVLPAGLQRRFADGATQLPFYYDASSPIVAATVTGVVNEVVRTFADRTTGTQPQLGLAAQPVAAHSFSYIDFLMPGVVAMAIMTNGIYAVSGTFVTYRQRGVLHRLRATPLPLASFIGAYVLTHLVRSLIIAGLVIAVGVFAFHVQVASGPTLLKVALVAVVGSYCFVTLGFFIAAVAKNIETAAAIAQVIGTPMMFLSGVFFPMEEAPAWIQPVVKAMPLTYLANALRDVIIKGETLWSVRWDLVVLAGVGTGFLALSVRYFRWD